MIKNKKIHNCESKKEKEMNKKETEIWTKVKERIEVNRRVSTKFLITNINTIRIVNHKIYFVDDHIF